MNPTEAQMKPLFIPLKTEYYRAFERGDKNTEYRLHGARWNGKVCSVGRPVILSRGYGKSDRIEGSITSFQAIPLSSISGGLLRMSLQACFPEASPDTSIACIGIKVR